MTTRSILCREFGSTPMRLATTRPSARCRYNPVAVSVLVLLWLAVAAMVSPLQVWAQNSPSSGSLITLNVKNMAIQEVLKIIAERGGLSLAIGTGVTGNVTLFVKDMTPERLIRLAVEMAGMTYKNESGIYHVLMPIQFEARYGVVYQDRRKRVFLPLEHAPIQEVMTNLAPLRSTTGKMIPDPRRNGLIVIDSAERVRQIRAVLEQLDRPLVTKAFELQNVVPQKMAEWLTKYLPATAIVEPDAGGNRVVVRATQLTIDRAGELARLLDRAKGIETRSFPLTYVTPDTIGARVQRMLTEEVGNVIVDSRTHQLVVTDFPTTLDAIGSTIALLDRPTAQVLIEARVIQVNLKDEIRTGIDWAVLQKSLNNLDITGMFPVLGDAEDGVRGSYGDLESKDYKVIVEALETFGKTNLLSSPRIMVSDGQKAKIHVGSQIPYKTIDSREGPNGVIDRFEKVTIVNVGVELEVQATVHNDGMVTMNVTPSVSSVTGFVDTIPIIDTSETSSTVTVRDGNTIILGGLNRDEIIETRRGVPILGGLPVLKYFFSSTSKSTVKTELAILLTPHIVTGNEKFETWEEFSEQMNKK